jgi:hypothetical protein
MRCLAFVTCFLVATPFISGASLPPSILSTKSLQKLSQDSGIPQEQIEGNLTCYPVVAQYANSLKAKLDEKSSTTNLLNAFNLLICDVGFSSIDELFAETTDQISSPAGHDCSHLIQTYHGILRNAYEQGISAPRDQHYCS